MKTKRKLNKTALKDVLKTIMDNPKHWHQEVWHCGTSHCFAGFAELRLHGLPIETNDDELTSHIFKECKNKNNRISKMYNLSKDDFQFGMVCETEKVAIKYLGLTPVQAGLLFAGDNTLEDLQYIVKGLIKGTSTRTLSTHINKLQSMRRPPKVDNNDYEEEEEDDF